MCVPHELLSTALAVRVTLAPTLGLPATAPSSGSLTAETLAVGVPSGAFPQVVAWTLRNTGGAEMCALLVTTTLNW